VVELILKEEVYNVIGAAIEVHRVLGPGFLEAVYQEAFEVELRNRGLPFEAQKRLEIIYKEQLLKAHYIADFICYDQIVVEIKALDKISGREKAQLIQYLKATDMRVGLLINFGSSGKLEWKRFVN